MDKKNQWKKDLKSPWLLGILGTVLISVLVNVVLISASIYYPHSLVAKDYYDKGKDYFHAQANEKNAAKILGYKLQLIVPDKPRVNVEEQIRLQVTDPNGKIIKEGKAILFAYRSNDNTKDFQLSLRETSDGQFVSRINFSLPGTWDLIAQITVSGEKLDVAERIFVEK